MDNPNLPIDIHLTKLLDWIIDRRHCLRDWSKNVMPIRNKINLAIQDMPEHADITALLSGSIIHYFNCLKIVQILQETEKNSKNIFGMYSSQRMKDWNNVVGLYQKNNIYLAETASLLQRNVAYEIPALRKAIQKSAQSQKECDDKVISQSKTVNEINNQIKQSCVELNIQGENISKELKSLPSQLHLIYETISKNCADLDKAVNFYTQYVEYFFKRKSNETVPFLTYMLKKGNTTVYEWRTGVEPKSIEKTDTTYNFGDETTLKSVPEASNEINFDLGDSANLQDQNAEIDWGDIDLGVSSDGGIELDAIDFGDIETLKSEFVIEDSGVYIPTDGIAKGDDAFLLLEWAETRSLLIHDLIKLETFLRQKLNEMKSGSDNLLMSTILQDAPKFIQSITEKDLRNYIDTIANVQAYFKSKKVEQLLRINDSPKFLQRIYDQFVAKQKSIKRCYRNQEQLKIKCKELNDEEVSLTEKLKLISQKTKELQKYVSDDLSKKYNGTRINIMGEINAL